MNQSSAIYSFSPATARVKLIGLLPVRLAGAMAVSLPDEVLVAGGVEPSGETNSTIYKVVLDNRPATSDAGG